MTAQTEVKRREDFPGCRPADSGGRGAPGGPGGRPGTGPGAETDSPAARAGPLPRRLQCLGVGLHLGPGRWGSAHLRMQVCPPKHQRIPKH